ncbi:MAG: hypothetical protein AABW50_05290 [Nanoarchaeota archaeon]
MGIEKDGSYKGFVSPLDFYIFFYEDEDLTSFELNIADPELHKALRASHSLREAVSADMRGVCTGRKHLPWKKIDKIKKMLEDGVRNSIIAQRIDVSIQTIYNYRRDLGVRVS